MEHKQKTTMAGKIYQQRDNNGSALYPQTVTGAVIDPDTGKTVNQLIAEGGGNTEETFVANGNVFLGSAEVDEEGNIYMPTASYDEENETITIVK